MMQLSHNISICYYIIISISLHIRETFCLTPALQNCSRGSRDYQHTHDIRTHLEEVYGLRVSADLISRVTDAVLGEVSDWQNRALEPVVYPIVPLKVLRVKFRDMEAAR